MTFRTRFAPSPTGPLHLGHAYSALLAHDMARQNHGQFLLRIEDIDQTRARKSWETQILDDLHWLGLSWPTPVMCQSNRLAAYGAALDALWAQDLLYPCSCSRKDIAAAASAPQEGAPLIGPDGVIYPGTCRNLPKPEKRPRDANLVLDIKKAHMLLGRHTLLQFDEYIAVHKSSEFDFPFLINSVGDVVLCRKEMGTSYHLSVVVDDAEQAITDVVRGADLFEATAIHVLLQRLLGFPTPRYHHHRLIRDNAGKRLAKRDDARAIRKYRDDGLTPQQIRDMVARD